jgi:hypothetical protein
MRKRITEKALVIHSILERIRSRVDVMHRKCANYLNKRCAKFSPRQLTYGLVIFCSVFGVSIYYTISNSFASYGARKNNIQIQIPRHAISIDSNVVRTSDTTLINKIIKQIDSMQSSDSSAIMLEQFKRINPGLLDSFKQIQRF